MRELVNRRNAASRVSAGWSRRRAGYCLLAVAAFSLVSHPAAAMWQAAASDRPVWSGSDAAQTGSTRAPVRGKADRAASDEGARPRSSPTVLTFRDPVGDVITGFFHRESVARTSPPEARPADGSRRRDTCAGESR